MKKDMTIIDGHHRLSAALSTCPDIRAFELEIKLYNEEIQEFDAATLFFDRRINRLAIKEANTTVFVIYQGHELGCKGVFEKKADAEKWVDALNNLDSTEKWHYEEKYLNLVQGFGPIVRVTKAIFDFFDGTIKSEDKLDLPTAFGGEINLVKHDNVMYILGHEIDRYVTITTSKLDVAKVFSDYQKSVTDVLYDNHLEMQRPKQGDVKIKLTSDYPL